MSNFSVFASAVKARFDAMSKGELFVTDIAGDALWDKYLSSFPEGANPMFRKRTEHDCSCCKNFIRNIANVVSLVDGKIETVWDNLGDVGQPYNVVVEALGAAVRTGKIAHVFRSTEQKYGASSTIEYKDGKTMRWNHFHAVISAKHFAGRDAAAQIGKVAAVVQVLGSGLQKLEMHAIETVMDLINSKSLYRGEEHLWAVRGFADMKQKCSAMSEERDRELFVWANIENRAWRFRNDVIGTLVEDLTDGKDLEVAVKSFEQKVAPTNYKRPTALITERMKNDALKSIAELGIEPSLTRRFARINDVNVNDILFVDNAERSNMRGGGIASLLDDAVASAPVGQIKAEDISIEDFLSNVVPKVTSMSVLVKNTQQANFVSLTAPVHEDAPGIFKWPNQFGWSYDGNITDSIKERVKAAGGTTDAVMRVSLAWFNHDDLDLHAIEPDKYEIYFGNRHHASPRNGGKLDVDMNAGQGTTREPVENIVWSKPQDGEYKIVVHNYVKRETSNTGFTLEVENNGVIQQFSCASSPKSGGQNLALTLTVKNRVVVGVAVAPGIVGGSQSQEKWGVKTEQFTKVNTMMMSPNFWGDSAVGNKHYFFMLDGCKNPVPTRGIYNEHLRSDLDKHRKVFEVLGNKTMCEPTDDQLSGVGFSSTRGDTVVVSVAGAKLRKIYNVKF